MHRNNENFKRIINAMFLDGPDLREVMRASGMEVSNDRINRWKRNPDAGSGRYSVMQDAEFDAFCEGLVRWRREVKSG